MNAQPVSNACVSFDHSKQNGGSDGIGDDYVEPPHGDNRDVRQCRDIDDEIPRIRRRPNASLQPL